MAPDVRATGRKSFSSAAKPFFGTGHNCADFPDTRNPTLTSERLKMLVSTWARPSAHTESTLGEMPSGPCALLDLVRLRTDLASSSETAKDVDCLHSVVGRPSSGFSKRQRSRRFRERLPTQPHPRGEGLVNCFFLYPELNWRPAEPDLLSQFLTCCSTPLLYRLCSRQPACGHLTVVNIRCLRRI